MGTVALAMAGCTDDEFTQNNNIPEGNGIVFGANASYAENPNTRTEYGEYEYEDGKKVSQVIEWLESDNVDIYSPASPTLKQVKYGITNIIENKKNYAYLKAYGDGLQWDRNNSQQSFYAIYPSIESMSNETVKKMVSFENGILKGYVPVNQAHTITKEGGKWVAKPNMDYLYMAAVQKDYPIPTPDDEEDGVSLYFEPLTTTLELTIEGPTETPIASINIFANNNENIAGFFECDLTQASTTPSTSSDLKCTYVDSPTIRNMITISGYYNDNNTQKPLTLADGESITFNVFLLPHQNLNNISVRIAGLNTASKTMSLNNKVTLEPHKKVCVKVKAPQISEGEENNWISGMNGNVLLSQLSIPGTANSFSYSYRGVNSDWYKAQTVSIDEQLKAGIRCFELRGPNSSTDDLADAPLQCNRNNLGVTFGEAVNEIWDFIEKNPGEFAIIMPAFESGEGRFVEDYASDLNKFFDNHTEYKYKTYTNNLTVGEARGHLLFIARITSEEDDGKKIEKPKQGVFIDQWGSLKDNWARRGYPVDNWAVNNDLENSMEYHMIYKNTNEAFEGNMPIKGTVNYMHETTRSDGSSGTAYVQDWARVVKEDKNYELYKVYEKIGSGWFQHYEYDYSQYAYWKESLTEKQDDIWKTFELSIEDNSNRQGSTFYINCLDGYFVDDNIPESYKPYIQNRSDSYVGERGQSLSLGYGDGGMAGNIGGFASTINDWFYNEILKYGEDNIYGPMNIVILDRVYEEGGGSYLPSVIINNNYRFPLLTIEDVQGQSANASYTSGGNAIQ